jgi:HPt (histidine-containing phosphotransfer) domain-containing protein
MTLNGDGARGPAANFDFSRLALISDGDKDFEREIAGEYLGQSRQLLAQISEAIRSGDAPALRQASHTLKGSSRTVGAEGLGELGAELEQIEGQLDPAATAEKLGRAQACLLATERRLDEYFGTDGYRNVA